MKIDVEGYEPDVLAGAKHLLEARRIENIFCEFNSWWLNLNSTTPKQLLACFLDSGYKIHEQTTPQENLAGRNGTVFDLQDIWFKLTDN